MKIYVVTTHLNRLIEKIQMCGSNTHFGKKKNETRLGVEPVSSRPVDEGSTAALRE
jgi:hypothetical protein